MSVIEYNITLDYSLCDPVDHDSDQSDLIIKELVFEDYLQSFTKHGLTPPKLLIEKTITYPSPFGEYDYVKINSSCFIESGFIFTLNLDIPKNSIVDYDFTTAPCEEYMDEDFVDEDSCELLIKVPPSKSRYVRSSIPNVINCLAFVSIIKPVELDRNSNFIEVDFEETRECFIARNDIPADIMDKVKDLAISKNGCCSADIDFQTY